MNRCRTFLLFTAAQVAVLAGLLIAGAGVARDRAAGEVPANREAVRRLGLTDLAVWTEARYTRHPSQADRFAAFQDFPSALDHFPAGSVLAPPRGAGGTP